MQFRIAKYDSRNWVLQEYVKGGINPITREQAQDKWIDIGYYGKLKDLVVYLVDKSIILSDDGKEILQAIKDAEANILKQIETLQKDGKTWV